MYVPWNVAHSILKIKKNSSAFKVKKSDVLVLSVGKSGRTWLRVLLNKYISLAYDIPFGLEDLNRHDHRVPSIFFTHELWEYFGKANFYQKVLGKYIVPTSVLRTKKVILLYRDPRDVLVSLYFHLTRRADKNRQLRIVDLMKDRKFGIHRIVQVLNCWRKRLENHPECFWLSYENMKNDTVGMLQGVIEFIGFEKNREELIREAVAFSEFENMQKMEAKGVFKSKILQPGDPSDPDSFKVRKGKVGGYVKHFSREEICFLNKAIVELDSFYPYSELIE
jgi:hypothetical protein